MKKQEQAVGAGQQQRVPVNVTLAALPESKQISLL